MSDGARLYRFSYLPSKKARPQERSGIWDDLIGEMQEAGVGECTVATCIGKLCQWKSVKAWMPMIFGVDPKVGLPSRRKAFAISADVLGLDVDDASQERLLELLEGVRGRQLRCFWHGSHRDGRDGKRCVRILLSASRPVTAAEWPAVIRGCADMLGIPADDATLDVSRLFFLPTKPADADFAWGSWDGADVDVDECLRRGEALLGVRASAAMETRLEKLGASIDDESEMGPAGPEVLVAARETLAAMGPAVDGTVYPELGSGGGKKAVQVGMVLLNDYDLPWNQAWDLVLEWDQGNKPPWRDGGDEMLADLEDKVRRGRLSATEPRGGRRRDFETGLVVQKRLEAQRRLPAPAVSGPGAEAGVRKRTEGGDEGGGSASSVSAVVQVANNVDPVEARGGDENQLPPPPGGFRVKQTVEVGPDIEIMARLGNSLLAGDSDDADRIYQRGGMLVQVAQDRRTRKNAEDVPPVIRNATGACVQARLSTLGRWIKTMAKGKVEVVSPPAIVAERIRAKGGWMTPYLTAVSECPVVRPDGSVHAVEGYDEATGVYLALGDGLKGMKLPENPGLEEAREAYRRLYRPFREYPWVEKCHGAAAVAYVCSVICRTAVQGPVPFFAVNAPQPNSGKSLLVDAVTAIATGSDAAPRLTLSRNPEEDKKQIDAMLFEGQRTALIDNVAKPFGGEEWDALATAKKWQGREMGTKTMRTVRAQCIWAMTGNNLTFIGDFGKRAVPIEIDAKMADPGARQFEEKIDLVTACLRDRRELVAAAITLVVAYIRARRPGVREESGIFGSWNRTIRGAVEWASGLDPWGGQAAFIESADPRLEAEKNFLISWFQAHGSKSVPTQDVCACTNLAFKNALEAVLPQDAKMNVNSVGKRLGKLKNKTLRVDNTSYRFEAARDEKARGWRVLCENSNQTSNLDAATRG